MKGTSESRLARRERSTVEGRWSLEPAAATQDAQGVGARDEGSDGEACGPVERALAELGIEWKDVMAFRVHGDRVVIIEGPVGYKRTYMLTGEEEVEG